MIFTKIFSIIITTTFLAALHFLSTVSQEAGKGRGSIVTTRKDDWDPDAPLVFNTDEWHMKEWASADRIGKNMMRQAFRNYFTGRNSLEVRIKVYKKLPPISPGESRDECNPYFVGVDFCGSNGDCVDLIGGSSAENSSQTNLNPTNDYFKCECHRGWQGQFCDKDINECALGICQNNAYCENFMPPKRYTCTCSPYTFGVDCEKTYPPSAEGFSCHSADNSSLIDWLTPESFELLDFFPEGRVKHPDMSGPDLVAKQLKLLMKIQRSGKKLGHIENMWLKTHARRVYIYNSLQPTLKESHLRPLEYIKYDNPYGWNFNRIETEGINNPSENKMPFEHVIEIIFPEPTLIRGFVTRGGLEKKKAGCDTCKRLVTKYRITFRSGARRWFKFIDQYKKDIIFSALDPGESYSTKEDLKLLDINRPRIRFPPNPFTAEAIRIQVIDWWPKNLQLATVNVETWNKNKYLAKFASKAKSVVSAAALKAKSGRKLPSEAQNPVLRFDVLGCHY